MKTIEIKFNIKMKTRYIENKIYREKSIPMTALWCPAFNTHG